MTITGIYVTDKVFDRFQDEHDTVLKKIDNDNAELTQALEDAKDKVIIS